MSEENAVIISKKPTEQVRVLIQKFKGTNSIHIRQYYMNDKGDWLPTPKGAVLPIEFIGELKDAVNEIERQIKELEEEE